MIRHYNVHISKLWATVLAFFLSLTASATAQPLSLDSARTMALEYNKSLAAARLQTRQYEHTMKSLRANFFPNFKIQANDIWSTVDGVLSIAGGYLPTFSYSATTGTMVPNVLTDATGNPVMNGANPVFKEYAYFPGADIKWEMGNVIQVGVTVEQPIYMGGKVTAGYKMGKLGYQMSRLNENLSAAQTLVDVTEAYTLLVQAQEMNKVAVEYDTLLSKLLRDVESAKRHGMVSQNEVLKVRVKKNEAELQVRRACNGVKLAQMNLAQKLGLPITETIEADPKTLTLHEDVSMGDITSRPEYQILDYQTQLANQKVKLARADFLPQVGVAAGYNYVNGAKVNNDKFIDGADFGVLVNVKVPLFHFGEGYHKVKAAKLEAERTQLSQQDLNEQMNLELRQAWNNLDEARLEAKMTETSLQQAAENLRYSRRAYDVGLESLSDLLEAQTLWQQAYARNVQARCNWSLQSIRYDKAAGRL